MKISEKLVYFLQEAIADKRLRIYDIPKQLQSKGMEFIDAKTYPNDVTRKNHKNANFDQSNEKLIEALFYGVAKTRINLSDIPERLITRKIALAAVRVNSINIEDVPKHIIDRDFCKKVIQNGWVKLNQLPSRLLDIDMCLDAIENDASNTVFIPEGLQTEWFYNDALSRNAHCLLYIPASFQTTKLFEKAVYIKAENIFYVPDFAINTNMACWALKNAAPSKRREIAEHIPTQIMTSAAVQRTIREIKNDSNQSYNGDYDDFLSKF